MLYSLRFCFWQARIELVFCYIPQVRKMTRQTAARPELAAFLRGRRARVHPQDVGLPNGSRRRTPGLRREEVAQLADVGASWYTWLEQGRDIHVSEALLERLAQALRLSASERSHLFVLAQGRMPSIKTTAQSSVSLTLRRVIDHHPYPAVVTTPRRDVVAVNEAAEALFGKVVGSNSLRSMFSPPKSGKRRPTWEADARRLVALFRIEAGRAADRSDFDALIAELHESSEDFRRLWKDHEIVDVIEGAKIISHPEVGAIELEHVTLMHAEPDGRALRVTLYTPKPGVSSTRAAKLFENLKG
jgi:transcriptional regulator with XRE-family HTH domain